MGAKELVGEVERGEDIVVFLWLVRMSGKLSGR